MTIGIAPLGWLEDLEKEPFGNFIFGAKGIAIYQLGNFGTASKRLDHTPRAELRLEGRVFRIVRVAPALPPAFRVVEIAEPLIEAMAPSAGTRCGRRDGSYRIVPWHSLGASRPRQW